MNQTQQDFKAKHRALRTTLEAFLASPDLESGVISSTRAAWGGSGYSVELFDNGTWRVLWDNQIGNRYQTAGIILSLPTVETDGMTEYVEGGGGTDEQFMSEAFAIAEDEIKTQLRDW